MPIFYLTGVYERARTEAGLRSDLKVVTHSLYLHPTGMDLVTCSLLARKKIGNLISKGGRINTKRKQNLLLRGKYWQMLHLVLLCYSSQ
jgi:hypothetical protein